MLWPACSGLYFVPINTHLAAPEVEYIVRDSEASVLVVHAELADKVVGRVEDAVPHRVVIGSAPANWCSYESFTDVSDDAPATRSLGSLMMYTSGTTGRPKGVRRPLSDAREFARIGRSASVEVGNPAGDPRTAFGVLSRVSRCTRR